MSLPRAFAGLQPVINLSGPLTMYGSSISSSFVAESAAFALQAHWDMAALEHRADAAIATWSGAEAGMLTSSSAAGVTLTVAACMTGADAGCIGQLPDTIGLRNEVVIQKGHAVNFGAPIEQMIRLSGAKVVEVGTVNRTTAAQLQHGITDRTAAAMFVVSHHTVLYGFVQLQEFVEICHERGVPVIVDAAAQDHQIERLVASGADLIILSAQKYLSAPTCGIVCGKRNLVDATSAQISGIGRTMKVGKEGIFGTVAAIEERMAIDLAQWESDQNARAQYLLDQIDSLRGIDVYLEKDKVGQPVWRVRLDVDAGRAGIDAETLAHELTLCEPSIKPRAHHTDEGWFYLEPVHITDDEMQFVAASLHRILA